MKTVRVLLLCDDPWHPGQIVIDGVEPLVKQGFHFDTITDAKNFKPEMLADYSVVLLGKSDQASHQDKTSWKTPPVQEAFVSYVENGGGVLAVHSGVVAGEHTEIMDHLIGCRFTSHPQAAPVTVQPLKPHFITESVEMFTETDEQYRIDILTPDADILIASYSTPEYICPAGYVRSQGKGRICVLTPGHTLEAWLNPQFQQTLKNALLWLAN